MKRWAIGLGSSGLLMAAGISFSQGEEPAEKVFKNIVSLKGTPAKDLMPAMRFMSASLKVECRFCHDEADYAKDVPKKLTTRKMVDLQREINEKYFEGKLEVTCNSCHNGLEHPVGVPIVEGLKNQHPRFRTETTPAELFKKHAEAVGGAGPILRWKGTMAEGAGAPQPFEFVQAADGRFLAILGGRKMGYDGTTAWVNEAGTTYKLDDDNKTRLIRMGKAWRSAAEFEGRQRVSVIGQEKVNDRNALIVRASHAAGFEEFYFDQETGLLVKASDYIRTSLGLAPHFIGYEDYRSVEGIKAPFRIRSVNVAGRGTLAQFESASAEPGFEAKGFAPPPD